MILWKQCCVSVLLPEPTLDVCMWANSSKLGMSCLESNCGPEAEVSSVRRMLLTEKGRQYVERNFERIGPSLDTDRETTESECHWDVYYDSRLLILARQAARLRETEQGRWELMICSGGDHSTNQQPPRGLLKREPLVSLPELDDHGAHFQNCAKVSGEELILLRLGIDPHLVRGNGFSMREILALYEIRPVARLSSEQCSFHADAQLSGPVFIELEHFHFDTAYAEPAAVAALLGQHGEATMRNRALQITVASFCMMQIESCADQHTLASAGIDGFLHAHGLDYSRGGSMVGSSALAAYLRACRPAHWRALLKAGIRLEPQPKIGVRTKCNIMSI